MAIALTPSVGKVYSFVFTPNFIIHNGIYNVAQILCYPELIQQNVDLFKSFYEPAGRTEAEHISDLAQLREDKFLKLLDPTTMDTATAMYVPTMHLQQEPDPNVGQYYTLAVALQLGIHKNPEQLSYIIKNLQEQFSSALGITAAPKLFQQSPVWMTEAEYEQLELDREAKAKSILNYFSENQRMQKEITRLQSKLAAYEEILTKIAK